jgi:hypothetical protein
MKPGDAQAAVEIDKLIVYLKRHQERVDYWFARKGATPLGAAGLSRRTSVSAMCGSSVQALGGI